MTDKEISSVRVDKWLWAARFHKTRSLASSEIQKGRVTVNEQRVKPARQLQVGDRLTVTKHPYRFELIVLGLSDQRGPASTARLLYEETAESIEKRNEVSQTLRAERSINSGLRGEGRPSKRQRRQIIRFRTDRDSGQEDS